MNYNIELIALIEKEDYPAIIKYLINELIDNSSKAQISIRNYELSSEERQFDQ